MGKDHGLRGCGEFKEVRQGRETPAAWGDNTTRPINAGKKRRHKDILLMSALMDLFDNPVGYLTSPAISRPQRYALGL
jgi:hypothetical protein